MKYIPDIMMAIGTCVLGVIGSEYIKLREQSKMRFCALVASLMLILLSIFLFSWRSHSEDKIQKNENVLFAEGCKTQLAAGNYTEVVSLLMSHGLNDSKANMIFGYLLCNGYGVEQNVAEGIKHYIEAHHSGEENAYDNMLISLIKNCTTDEKTDIIRKAYQEGNTIAINYTNFIVDGLHSDPASGHSQIMPDELWGLDDQVLKNILNEPVYTWVGSNVSYNVSMSTASTPNFTRRYLYQTGTTRVYEEMYQVLKCYNAVLPLGDVQWLQEKLW